MKKKDVILCVTLIILTCSISHITKPKPNYYVAGNNDEKYYVLYNVSTSLIMNENDQILTKFTVYPYSSIFTHGNGQKYIAAAPGDEYKFIVIWSGKKSYCDYLSPCIFTGKNLDNITFIYNGVTFTGNGEKGYGVDYIEIGLFIFMVILLSFFVVWGIHSRYGSTEVKKK